MYTWNNSDSAEPKLLKFSTLIIFASAAASALIMAVLLHTYFNDFMVENPVVNYILFGGPFEDEICIQTVVDVNEDGTLNILDVIQVVTEIIGTTFRGAVEYLIKNFPELEVERRLQELNKSVHFTK